MPKMLTETTESAKAMPMPKPTPTLKPQPTPPIEMKDGKIVQQWQAGPEAATFAHNSAIRSLAFTPDSKLLVVGRDTKTPMLDAASGKETTTLPLGGVRAASADANLLAGSAPDHKRVIWDVAGGRARAVLPVGSAIEGAAFSRDGKTPPPLEQGRKETVEIGGDVGREVRILITFDEFLGRYVFHCHNIEHEDMRMMAQFEVQP